ncbi:MAG: class I SAM-dependent methyltransferase [Candidatus Aenigmatarchaeota archaeon]
MNKFAWEFYGISYDKIKNLPAYRKMIEDVYRELEIKVDGIYLDAGCGTGELLKKIISEKNAIVYGIDFSLLMLKRAFKKLENRENVFLGYEDLNKKLKFKSNFFDGIACVHVLSSIKNPKLLLQEFYRILKPEGKLVVCDLKKNFSYKPLISSFKESIHNEKFKAFELLFHVPILGTFNILQDLEMKKNGKDFFTKEILENLFRDTGFSTITIKETYSSQSILISGRKDK